MAKPRRYHQFCGCARALDVVGERWTLLIVRDLLLGPRRYGDLLAGLPGLTTNLLAKRMRELVAAGIVEKVALPAPASGDAYALTRAGAELEPVIMALGRWGGRYMDVPRRDDVADIRWPLLSLKRRYAGGIDALDVELRFGERRFLLRFEPDSLTVSERAGDRADLSIAIGEDQLRAALFGRGPSLKALARDHRIDIAGDPTAFARFAEAFTPLPAERARH
jgi:DNA-binding HxlR family transcriptional regulator